MPQFRRRLVLIAGSALLSLSAVPATLLADWHSVAPETAGVGLDR
jgi:hypothetical protein